MLNVLAMLIILMMDIHMNVKAVIILAKLVMVAVLINALVVKKIIIGIFRLLSLAYASKDIMIIHNFNVIHAIILGFP